MMSDVPRGANRRWIVLAAAGLALATSVLWLASDALRRRAAAKDAAAARAVGEVRIELALAHLEIEEQLAPHEIEERLAPGERPTGTFGSAFRRLDRAAALASVLSGESPPTAVLTRLPAGEARRRAAELGLSIERFQKNSQRREKAHQIGLPVGVGSAMDATMDALFAAASANAVELGAALDAERPRREAAARWTLVGTVAGWTFVLAVATGMLVYCEGPRMAAEEALRASEVQLLESQRLETVGRIAGGLAHDVNNYLGAIRGHCELVRMKLPAGDRAVRKMTAAIRAVEKAAALIDRLLAFGRMQEGDPVVVDLNQVIGGLHRLLAPTVGERIEIEERLADGLWNVEIDVSKLDQIVANLVLNARDAMPGGGRILIETKNVPGHESGGRGASVLLAVTDTGCGIAPEIVDKIFDPFWTTKKEEGNSGLGLATVQAAVEQSGGAVEVRSKVGRGTSFRVLLPRSSAAPSGVFGDETSGRFEPQGGGWILLVDDNEEFREATGALLEALGYRVTEAAGGEEACALFRADVTRFDLVMTDVVMPGLSGPELVARLRRERDVPAVFLSGHSEDVARYHGVGEGGIHFLRKQFSRTQLATAVREALDRGDTRG